MSPGIVGRAPGRQATRAMPRRVAAWGALLLLAASCAAAPCRRPAARDVVILLPDAGGKAGAIVVAAGGAERLLSEPGQAVSVAAGAAPGQPFVMSDAEIRDAVGAALDALPQRPLRFVFYFEQDSSALDGESAATMGDALRAIKERDAADISVVGHTDTVGDKAYNDRLSLERARAVAALLVAGGVDRSILEIASHGKDNPLVPTGDQVAEPRNRRVEVTVR